MNWKKKRYSGFNPGDLIIITNDGCGVYPLNGVFTLKHQYVKDGVWLDYNVGEKLQEPVNLWDTIEHPDKGLDETDFKLFTDE